MNAQHEQWLAAKDCYFDFNAGGDMWMGPYQLSHVKNGPMPLIADSARWVSCRPSRSPGVLVCHDGSDKRPKWVPENAPTVCFLNDGRIVASTRYLTGEYWGIVVAFMWRMP